MRNVKRYWALRVVHVVVALLWLFPLYWILSAAAKPSVDVFNWPPVFIPPRISLGPMRAALDNGLLEYLMHSAVINAVALAVSMVLGIMGGYALARRTKKGATPRGTLMWILSLTMMPPVFMVIPFFLVFSRIHFIDTYQGMILAYTSLQLPLCLLLLWSYMLGVPEEIEEAGQLDGARGWRLLWSVILPVARPGIAVTAVLALSQTWGDFLFASELTNYRVSTLPILLASYLSSRGIAWGGIAATSLWLLAPIVIAALLARRNLISGLSLGAVR